MGSKPLYIVAGQSNAGFMLRAKSFEKYFQENDIDAKVVHSYRSGTGISPHPDEPDWYPFNDGDKNTGELFKKLIFDIQSALNRDPDLYLAGVLWMHGERDSVTMKNASLYETRLSKIHEVLTTRFGKDFTFSLSQLSENFDKHQGRRGADEMREQQAKFANKLDKVTMIDPDIAIALSKIAVPSGQHDHVHFSNAGADAIAAAFLDQFHKTTPASVGHKVVTTTKGAGFKSHSVIFDEDGNRVASHRITDKDVSIVGIFSDDALVFKQTYDVEDNFAWSSRVLIYDLDGRLLRAQIEQDKKEGVDGPGRRIERNFDDNLADARLNNEIEAFLAEDWYPA